MSNEMIALTFSGGGMAAFVLLCYLELLYEQSRSARAGTKRRIARRRGDRAKRVAARKAR